MEKHFPKCLTRLGRHNLNSPVQKKSFCVRVPLKGNLIKELSSVENGNNDRFKNCFSFCFSLLRSITIDVSQRSYISSRFWHKSNFHFNDIFIFCNAQFVKQSYARVNAFTGISNLDLYTNVGFFGTYTYIRIHLAKRELYLIHVRSRIYDWADFQCSMSSIIDKR